MSIYQNFLDAINQRKIIKVKFNSQEKGVIERNCIPFDFGASQKENALDKSEKYHLLDLNSPDGPHNLALNPNEIIDVEVLDERFDPIEYVTWRPKWIYKRDWGSKS